MDVLYETNQLRLERNSEVVLLRNKSNQKILMKEDFLGDASCGIIDKDGNWAVVGGEYLLIWTVSQYNKVEEEGLKWIHSLRFKNWEILEILTDPWSEYSAVWELNLQSFQCTKVRDFNDYKNQKYTEEVIW